MINNNPPDHRVDQLTPQDQIAYYARLLPDMPELRVIDSGQTRHLIDLYQWTAWMTHPADTLYAMYSPELAERLRNPPRQPNSTNQLLPAPPSPFGYMSHDDRQALLHGFIEFPKRPNFMRLGFVFASDLLELVKAAHGTIDVDHETIRNEHRDARPDSPIIGDPLNTHGRTAYLHGSRFRFYTEYLTPLSYIGHHEENVLVYLQEEPADPIRQKRHLGLVGHNWRALIALREGDSIFEQRLRGTQYYRPLELRVKQPSQGKVARTERTYQGQIRPTQDQCRAYDDAPRGSQGPTQLSKDVLKKSLERMPPPHPTSAQSNLQKAEAQISPHSAPPVSNNEGGYWRRDQPNNAKPPLPKATRLFNLAIGTHFLRVHARTNQKTQHVEPYVITHKDEIRVAMPFRMDRPTMTMADGTVTLATRPVATPSGVDHSVLQLDLPTDTWVVPLDPEPQYSENHKRAPSKNPHNYETTEGMKRRLSKSIF